MNREEWLETSKMIGVGLGVTAWIVGWIMFSYIQYLLFGY